MKSLLPLKSYLYFRLGSIVILQAAAISLLLWLFITPGEQAGSDTLTLVVDAQGLIVADSTQRHLGQSLNVGPRSSDRRVSFELDGQPLSGTWQVIEGTESLMLIVRPSQNRLRPPESSLTALAIGLVIIFGLTLSLFWFLSNRLSITLQSFFAWVQTFAEDEPVQQWPQTKTKEFHQLGLNLQHIVGKCRQREKDLLESEARLKITLDSIGDAVIATDEQGLITRINPMAEQLTGWSAADAKGQPLLDVFKILDGFTRQPADNPVDKVLADGHIVGLANNTLLQARDGREYQIADSGAPIRNTDGLVVGVVLVFRDITESYAQEQQIRDNEQLLKDLVSYVPGLVYQYAALSPDTVEGGSTITSLISDKSLEILGIDPEPEAFFDEFVAHLPEEDQSRFVQSVKEVVETPQPWRYEGRFIKPGGENIWIEAQSVPRQVGDITVFNGIVTDITQRKAMESSLRFSQFIFDKADMAIFVLNEEGDFLRVNEQVCRYLGYSKDELHNMNVFDVDTVLTPDIWPQFMENLRAHGAQTIETLNRRKDGKVIPVQVIDNVMTFEGEEFHVAFVQDISQRKEMEQALKENEQRLDLALSSANEGIWDWHIAHDEVYFDTRYYTMAGYLPDEFPSSVEEWEKRIQKDDLERVKPVVVDYLAGKLDTYEVEFRFLRKDGRYMWIQAKGEIVERDNTGKPTRMIGTHADITQRRNMEESLRLTQFTFDNASIAIYRIAPDSKILEANHAAAKMLGYSKREIESLSIIDIDPLVDKQAWQSIWRDQVEKKNQYLERTNSRKDGTLIPVDVYSSLAEYAGQQYIIAYIQDVTQRKQMERTLKLNEERLEMALWSANEGIWDMILNPETIYFDSGYYSIAGYGFGEYPPTREAWKERVHPDDIERIQMEFDSYMAGEVEALELEYRFRRKDGSYMWIQDKGRVIERDEDDNPLRLAGTHADVTQRRQMEESLRLTRFTFDNANIGIYRISPTAQIIEVNPKAAQMLGYSKRELESLSIMDIDPAVDAEAWNTVWQTQVESQSKYFERTHRRKDGTLMPVEVYANYAEYSGQQYSIAFVQDISQRKQMEQALKVNEERLDMALSSANEGIWDRSLDPDVIYLDTRYYTLAGYQPDEFPATFEEWEQRVHKDDIARVKSRIDEFVAGKHEDIDIEYRFLRKDGSYMWVHDKGKIAYRDDDGRPLRLSGTHADISQRKQMEDSLRLTQFIFDEAPIGIWRMGESGEVLDVNAQGCASLGYTREELRRMTVFDFAPGYETEDWDYAADQLQKVSTVTIEAQHQRSNGDIFPIQVVAKLMRFEGQEYQVAFVQEITQRKQNEEELRRLRNYLNNIIDSMPSALIGVDSEGNVTQWNKTVEQSTGITADAARGKSISVLLPWMSTATENIRRSIHTREVIQEQAKSRSCEDDTCYEDVTIYPLVTNGVEGAVIRVDDVTEKIRLQEMMIQSEKMLSVGGLAAGMAHEINNPLAGILQTANVMSNRLADKLDNPASLKAAEAAGTSTEAIATFMNDRGILRMLEAIKDSGRRVAEIVDNMLSFARKSTTAVSSHSLNELLDKTLKLAMADYDLKKEFDFKQIEIVREYDDQLPEVPCEGAKIQQVLLNLLSNGAQAMSENADSYSRFILRTYHDRQKQQVCLEVEDNGPGMDEATRKRVFEPFFTTKPVGVGTGLGLSVSYFIITENHDGHMSVRSTPGEGSCFKVCLPIHRQSSA